MFSNCNFIISIIIGVVFGVLVGSGIVTVTTPLIFSLILILSVLFLVLLFAALDVVEGRCYRIIRALVLGILSSIILSSIALTMTMAVSSFLLGVCFFLIGTAFLFEIFSLKDLILCIISRCRD